jgi:ubiquinone/menaquinone biosynthesis C-methylase UbiE
MTLAHAFNQQQLERWNGADGEYWVQEQESLERNLAPVTAPLLAFASPKPGSTVIDIGCGCGSTTLALATAVGPGGRVIGIDISGPMLGRAKERLGAFANASCLLGDAATLPLADIRAELAISLF